MRNFRGLFAALALGSASCWAQSFTLTTFAGAEHLGDGKQATAVPLRQPWGVAQDAAGNIYVADADDNRIRKVSPTGVISTLAGTGRPGYTGDGGLATTARLNRPLSLRLDSRGNLYFSDYNNSVVRKIDLTTGIITTVAGDGTRGYGGDNVAATRTGMAPFDIALDSDGNLYIADPFANRVRRVNASDGLIQTIAGTGSPGFSGNGTLATAATLNFPLGVAVDAQKNVYIADYDNGRLRRVTASTGIITTIAGTGIPNISGNGGPATSAAILYPHGVAIEANGDVLVVGDYDIRRITVSTGIIRNVASAQTDLGFAGDGGPVDAAIWSVLGSVAVAPNADIVVADFNNYRVRRIRSGVVTTVAGIGLVNDVGTSQAFLDSPAGMAFNATGGIVFADRDFHQVRSIDAGRVTKVFGDGYATSSLQRLDSPEAVAVDRAGLVLIADSSNDRILRISGGTATVVAGGRGATFNGFSGSATSIAVALPSDVLVDTDGTLYIADLGNCLVRKVTLGLMTTVAGNRSCSYSGDGAQGASAGLFPFGLALDGRGGLLIATSLNHRIRRLDLTTGIITTIAGIGTAGHSGDGGPATLAQINDPRGIAVDSTGRIFFSEYGVSMVRMIEPNGTIRTIAGTGEFISNGESGPATSIAFDPVHLLAGPDGSIYVSDELNDRIRKLAPAVPSSIQVVQGAGASGPAGTRIPLQVRIAEASGIPVANLPVRFQVTSGTAQVSSASTVTTAAGLAQVEVTLGATLGPVVVTVSSDGVPSVTVNMTVTVPPVPVPQLNDVVGAGLSIPSVRALSTGGILTAFGANFGVGATFRKVGNTDLVNGKVPTNFAGICIDVAGTKAPVFGASDTQVNFQAPAGLTGNVAIKVLTACGTANEKASAVVTVPVQTASPEFFYFAASTTGRNPVAATDSVTGALLASPSLFPSSGIRAAKPGSFVTVYATGFGDTTPSYAPGDFPAGIGSAQGTIRVLLNGQALPASNILYAGVTPNSPGLFQLNIQVPTNAATGDLTLVIEIGGMQSPAGAFLTVAP